MTMPTTGFNVPRGSFPSPIAPIGVGPLDGPQVAVHFNYKWCSVIVGSLSQLLLNTTWDVATQAELTAIQEDVFDLMASFCVAPLPAGATPEAGAGGDDDFMLRQNPDNACELQTSVDGVTWCTWADLSKCLPSPAQPGTGSPQPAPGGGCQTYHAVLPANGKWLVPTFINSGDLITVSNIKGVWNGGTVNWYCPDGTPFVGFFCIGLGGTVGGDPLPADNHMSLIAGLSGGLYIPATGGPVTVPGGIVSNTLWFQANDSVLTDNAGQLEFDVQICNEQAAPWTHIFDFTVSPKGFVSANGGTSFWTPGVGWQAGLVGPNSPLRAILAIPTAAHLTQVSVTLNNGDVSNGPPQNPVLTFDASSTLILAYLTTFALHSAQSGTFPIVGDSPGTRSIEIAMDTQSTSAPGTISQLTVSGTGPEPVWP